MIKIRVQEVSGKKVLSGAAAGQAIFPKLVAKLGEEKQPATVAVDFSGIDVVTASCFREAFRAFRDYVRRSRECPVIFTNATESILEEAQLLADHLGDAFVFAELRGKVISAGIVIGRLEDKQVLTLKLLSNLGEADARQVQEKSGENTGTTVWNNRLSALSSKGLLSERSEGRTKYYRPVIARLAYGK
jgi:hypothetical protein